MPTTRRSSAGRGGFRDDPRLQRPPVPARRSPRAARGVVRAARPAAGGHARCSASSPGRRSVPPREGDVVLRLYLTPGREGEGRPTALAMVSTIPAVLEERRATGMRMITVPLGLDPEPPRGSPLAARRRQVDELRREHGRRGGGTPARRRRRGLPRRRAASSSKGPSRTSGGGGDASSSRPSSTSGSWPA